MNMMKEDIEFRSPAEIEEYRNGRLREALRYLADNSPFYRRVFRDNGININDIRTTEDLVKIPFTEKKTFNSIMRIFFVCHRKK